MMARYRYPSVILSIPLSVILSERSESKDLSPGILSTPRLSSRVPHACHPEYPPLCHPERAQRAEGSFPGIPEGSLSNSSPLF